MFLTRDERIKRDQRRARRIWLERLVAFVVLPPLFLALWWGGTVAYEFLSASGPLLLQ